jgi:desulfoferrodoxin (superoxide reductase-like protein)
MKKREFLKILGVTSVAVVAASQLKASDEKTEVVKKVEVKAEEWKSEPENKHTPIVKVTREGDVSTLTIDVTKHPQTADHYIDGIEIRDENKAKIFSSSIAAVGGVSIVTCQLKLAVGTKLTALSHCNKHSYYQAPVVL